MSYDIQLLDPATGRAVEFDKPHGIKGGTFTPRDRTASLNVTYNYSSLFKRSLGENGIRTIYGMTGKQSIPVIEKAMKSLGDDVSANYWAATEGNAKRALKHLLNFAKSAPQGIWSGD